MTRTFLTLIASTLMISACGAKQKEQAGAEIENENRTTLVAYFSATGTTAAVAKKLATAAGADLYEIKPEKPYTIDDLDWHDAESRSSVEMKDKNSRPSLADKNAKLENYSTIYVGFPIWWYTAPTIINTFLEAYDIKGKTIIPFCTSGGSTIEQAGKDLSKAYPQATWKQGATLNSPSEEELRNFIKNNK